MFDYEWAKVQHNVNCRLCATRSSSPRRSRPSGCTATAPRASSSLRGAQGGVLPRRLRARPGGPGRARPRPAPADRRRPHAAVRVASTTASRTTSSPTSCARCASRPRPSSCPASTTSAPSWQRAGGFIVPERAIDAQSLIAYADLVVSAGGTMNREAVALGTPGLHDLRRPPRRRRRAPHRRGPPPPSSPPPPRSPSPSARHRAHPDRIRRDPRDLLALALAPR